MAKRQRQRGKHKKKPKDLPRIDRFLFVLAMSLLLGISIFAVDKREFKNPSEVTIVATSVRAAAPTAKATATAPLGEEAEPAEETSESERGEAKRAGWPRVDRSRLRYGVVDDVADAFQKGEESGVVALSTLSERYLFEEWRGKMMSWPEQVNRNPVLFSDNWEREERHGGKLAHYRVKLRGEELGRVTVERYQNRWNIVGIERKKTEADRVARERIIHEAGVRAGVAEERQ